ncbi:MAG TPA: hypothetical protein VG777_08830, partial [Thermoanaerobaculia bacterium]|nr:hypothetical protein [Thermoanaerobaculia bacterium]
RGVYRERRDALVEAIVRELAGRVRVGPADGGFQVVLRLAADEDDREVARRAAAAGIDVTPLSRNTLGKGEPALILGYSALAPEAIRTGVRALARVLRAPARTRAALDDRVRPASAGGPP